MVDVKFRNKEHGWRATDISVYFKEEGLYSNSFRNNDLLKKDDAFDISIYVESFPLNAGKRLEITINGIDHSKNKRGLNIVVYDIDKRMVYDFVNFGTHLNQAACSRGNQAFESIRNFIAYITENMYNKGAW